MQTMALPPEVQALERLRDQELEEARSIQSVLEECSLLSPNELLSQVFREVEAFSGEREQHDDMAAALFTCTA